MTEFNNNSIRQLEDIISKSSTVSVVAHVHPDGDALGSTVALSSYLRARGKQVCIILPDSLPDNILFMLSSEDYLITASDSFESAQERIYASDTLFALDLNGFSRTDVLEETLRSSRAVKVLIDHHLDPQNKEFDLVFSRNDISSASELLFWILMELPDVSGDVRRLPAHAADALMTGMTTDTNNFGNSVFPSTLKMASLLLEAGVDRDAIVSSIYNNYREERYRLLGYLLDRKMKITSRGVAYMILDGDEMDRFDVRESDTEAFVNIPLGISSVCMSIFLKQKDGVFRVSIRSKKGVSANTLARRYFNGGGHEQAAGGRLYLGTDVADATAAAEYIEKYTELFFSDEK